MQQDPQARARIGILFALPEERAPFLKMRISGIVSACSGAGAANASRGAEKLLGELGVSALLIVGFGGGLSDSVPVGSLLVADAVLNGEQSLCPDSRMLASTRATRAGDISITFGPLLSSNRVLITAKEKREAAKCGALAVDMESAAAAAQAERFGIPWLSVRAITDGVDDSLPLDFNALAGPDGSIDRSRIARAALMQPTVIPALIRLGQRSALAAGSLALFLQEFLRTYPGEDR